MDSDVPIDRGWAWVVTGASFLIAAILIGIAKCFGIIFAELLVLYGASASEASIMLALSAGLALFTAPLATMVAARYTTRVTAMIGGLSCSMGFFAPAYCTTLEATIFTFGILTGFGYGFSMCSATITISQYFEKWRALAIGIMFSGAGFGGILAPMFVSHIISEYGLRIAFVILSGVILQSIVLAAVYRPMSYWRKMHPSAEDPKEATIKTCLTSLCDLRLLKNWKFSTFTCACALMMISGFIGMIIPAHCADLGISKEDVAVIISVQSIANTVGQILVAFIGDRSCIKTRRVEVALIWSLICAISTYCSVYLTTFHGIVSYVAIVALAADAFVTMVPVIVVDIVGVENFGQAWGLLNFLEGFSFSCAPIIIGALRDLTLTYTSALRFLASCFSAAAVLILIVIVVVRIRH